MEDNRQQQLDDLHRAFESGALPEEIYREAIIRLGVEPETARYDANVEGDGIVVQGRDNVVVNNNSVYVRGDFHGTLYMGAAPNDNREKVQIYRQWAVQQYGRLPMHDVTLNASDATGEDKSLALAHVYVDLDTTGQMPHRGDDSAEEEKEQKPISVLQKVIEQRQMVLLGDPGGGKTTFLNHLAYELAWQALQTESELAETLLHWPAEEADLLPLPVVLRDFAQTIPEESKQKAHANDLWVFIEQQLQEQQLGFMIEPLAEMLDKGKVLLLFDGLDEVGNVPQRVYVRNAMQAFCSRYANCRCVVTCRVLAYQPPTRPKEVDLRLNPHAFPTVEIAPFDDAKINRFIGAWYDESAQVGAVTDQEAPVMAKRLQQGMQQPDLHRLATNPLMLTVMALVNSHHDQLPTARALLYEETVELLLWRWEHIKSGTQTHADETTQQKTALKHVLWRLAYDVHNQSDAQIDGDTNSVSEQAADISAQDLEDAIGLLTQDEYGHPDHNWTQGIIRLMQHRAGLLVKRRPGIFSFPHRSFQEYLAGAYLSTQANFATEATKKAKSGSLWRDVILLAVGRFVHVSGDMDKPLALIAELCPETALDDPEAWRLAWLAGDVLLEIDDIWIKQNSAFGRDLHRRVRSRLAALVAGGHLTPRERAEAGQTLARLGDPRQTISTFTQMPFCYVAAGPFWMWRGDDAHLQESCNYPFWISRLAVSNAQYEQFIADDGYKNTVYWAEAIQLGKWEAGKTMGWHNHGWRERPFTHGFPFYLPNHPVVGITWFEAVAFTRWLAEKWQHEQILPDNWTIRLPSATEWEKAARGGLLIPETPVLASLADINWQAEEALPYRENPEPKRKYPWGNQQITSGHANFSYTQISGTNTLGAFPQSQSPYGAEEMCGNVWEWTRSYPSAHPHENGTITLEDHIVLRGGAHWSPTRDVTSTAWARRKPYDQNDSYGFRIVIQPKGI